MKIVLRALAAIAVVIGLLLAAVRLLNPPLPDTATMRAYFSERRAVFERHHATMSAALAARGDVHAGRNDSVGYAFGVRVPGGIVYITHTRGFGLGIHGTGLARLASRPVRLYPTLEAMREDARAVEGFIGFGAIEDGWYFVLWEVD